MICTAPEEISRMAQTRPALARERERLAKAMLAECRVAADAVAHILDRLQRLTVYRTEPYLLQPEPAPSSSNSAQLIKI